MILKDPAYKNDWCHLLTCPPHADQRFSKDPLQIKGTSFGSMPKHSIFTRHLVNGQGISRIQEKQKQPTIYQRLSLQPENFLYINLIRKRKDSHLILGLTHNIKVSHTRLNHQHISTLSNISVLTKRSRSLQILKQSSRRNLPQPLMPNLMIQLAADNTADPQMMELIWQHLCIQNKL
jgi:hypothetical protein